jgi:hypothetical protein
VKETANLTLKIILVHHPGVLHVTLHDPVWDWFYAPVAFAVGFAAERLNHLQFLTIRRYLMLVFVLLILLLLVAAIWL